MTRVKVWRDQDHYLGEGELIGWAPMTEVYPEEEYKKNYFDFLRRFTGADVPDEFLEEKWQQSIKLQPYSEQKTPKIILDNGEIVYGCQIWWEEIKESEVKRNE